MRVSTDDAVSVFKKFTSLEEASKASAMLFQSFNMNIDAFDLLTSRDPGEMLTQFRNAMRSTGKSFESLSRHEKALLQSITGISDQGLSSMMSMMDANMSYEEARKKMDQHDPVKQKTKMIKGLTTAIKQFQKIVQFESPFSAFFQGLMENVLSQQNLQGQLINFNKVYESIYQIAFNITPEEIQGITRPLVAVLTKIKNIFTGGGIEKLMTSVAKVASGFVSDISVDLLSKKESKQFLSFRLKVQETLKLLKHNEAEAVKTAMLNETNSNLSSLKPFLDSKEASSALKRLFEKDKNGVYSLTKGITVDSLLETLTNSAENLPENSQYKKTLQNFRFRLSRIYEQKVKNLNKSGTLNQASKAVTNRLSVKGRINSLYENLLGLFSEGQPLFIEFHNLSGRIMGAIVEGALSGMIALLELFNGGVDKSVVALNIASEKEIKKQFPDIKDPKKATLLDLMGITRSNYDELGNELSQESSRFVERLPSLMSIAGKLMGDLLGIFGTFAASVIGLVGGFTMAYYEKASHVERGIMRKAGFSPIAATRAKSKSQKLLKSSQTIFEMQKVIDKKLKKDNEKEIGFYSLAGDYLNFYDTIKNKYHKESEAYKFLNSKLVSSVIENVKISESDFFHSNAEGQMQKLTYVINRIALFGQEINQAFPSEVFGLIESKSSNSESDKKMYLDLIKQQKSSNSGNIVDYANSIVKSKYFGGHASNLTSTDFIEEISTLITRQDLLSDASKESQLIQNLQESYNDINVKSTLKRNLNYLSTYKNNKQINELVIDEYIRRFESVENKSALENPLMSGSRGYRGAFDFYAKEKGMKVLIGDKIFNLHDEDSIIAFKSGGYFEKLFAEKEEEYFRVINKLGSQNTRIIAENQKLKSVVKESIINKEEEASQEDIMRLVDLFLEVNSLIEDREIIVEKPRLMFN